MLHRTRAGQGPAVVLLHGLTATHRYVVMGSRALERSGHDVLAYDARGHGASDPAPDPEAYTYADLTADLVDLLDEEGIDRAVLAGPPWGRTRPSGPRWSTPIASPAWCSSRRPTTPTGSQATSTAGTP
ncbi:alpha/beta fold hydrolase [Baekduia soli]|uniref:alpha/beta fold hydrolase n=1 Tax=Baekduia soli TaxID=496014 RepID=UPI001E5712A2|nr:alpha/beta fold hydrolase [Baekduia soli]